MDPFTIAAIIMAVASFAYAAFLAPKPSIQNPIANILANVSYPTASNSSPVPLVLGTIRMLGPNTLWYGDFSTFAMGKYIAEGLFGLEGKKQVITGYEYFTGLDLALCLGPDVELLTVWAGQYTIYVTPESNDAILFGDPFPQTQGQPPQLGAILSGDGDTCVLSMQWVFGGPASGGGLSGQMIFYGGSYTQSQDPYLARVINNHVPAYNGICHIVFNRDFSDDRDGLVSNDAGNVGSANLTGNFSGGVVSGTATGAVTGDLSGEIVLAVPILDGPVTVNNETSNGITGTVVDGLGNSATISGDLNGIATGTGTIVGSVTANGTYSFTGTISGSSVSGTITGTASGAGQTASTGFFIGTSTQLNPFSFELRRITNSLGIPGGAKMPNGFDINAMEAVYFILTDPWSGTGLDGSFMDAPSFLAAAATAADDITLGLSVQVDQPNSCKDIVNLAMQHVNGLLHIDNSTGKIKVKLLRADYVVGELPVLGEDTVLQVKDFVQTLWTETFNQCRVSFVDRTNSYSKAAAVMQDFANFNMQKRLLSTDINSSMCRSPAVALAIATRELALLEVPLFKVTLVCNRNAASIQPGDPFILNWPEWGIVSLVCRTVKVDLGSLEKGNVSLTVIQDVFGDTSVIFAPPAITLWQPVLRVPSEISIREVAEAGWFLQAWSGNIPTFGSGRLIALPLAPSGASQSWWGYASLNNFFTNTTEVTAAPYLPSAILTNAISGVAADPETMYDTTVGLVINSPNNALNTGDLAATVTDTALRGGANMVMIDDEVFNFTHLVNNMDTTFTLTNVRRGLLDTAPMVHATNARLYFISDASCVFADDWVAGQDVESKLQDQTDFGQFVLPDQPYDTTLIGPPVNPVGMSDEVVTGSRSDRPLRPRHLTADGSATPATGGATVTLAWRESLRTQEGMYWEDDATATPESGQSYVVLVSENGASPTAFTVASGTTSYVYTYVGLGTMVKVQVYSISAAGLRSWTPATLSFIFIDGSFDGVDTRTDLQLVVTRSGDILNYE